MPPLPHKAHLVARHVRELIAKDDLQPGDPLPTERQLAAALGFGHVTVRRGLSALVNEGLIVRRVGHGTFVARPTSPAATTEALLSIVVAVNQGIADLPQVGYSLAGVRSVFAESRARLEVVGIQKDRDASALVKMLRQRQADGLLYQGYLDEPMAQALLDLGVPTVSLGMRLDSDRIAHVRVDLERLLGDLVHEARRFGHRQIALAHWANDPGDRHRPELVVAFEAACRRYDLSPAGIVDMPAPATPDPELVDVRPLFDLEPRPTCVIVNDEVMAAAVYRELARRRLRVPDDVSLMALIDCAPHAHPIPLTAPAASDELLARYRLAATALADLLAGRPLTERVIRYRSVPTYRASLGPTQSPVGGR